MSDPRNVLIVGDSISIGYTPFVAEGLSDDCSVSHHEGNGGDTANLLARIEDYLSAGESDVVHFNAGLHDIKRQFESTGRQVPLDDFRRNLHEICARLKATNAAVIWGTITPVIYSRHHAVKDFDRFAEDVDAYNAAAFEIVTEAGFAVDDLHAVVAAGGPEELICEDGVHMTEQGYRLLGRSVARAIRLSADGTS